MIQYFLQCGIQLWLVTGDQVNTAISISKNCGILQDDKKVIIWNNHNPTIMEQQWKELLSYDHPEDYSIVMTGVVLSSLLGSDLCKSIFKQLIKVHSVICCRVTPKQKVIVFHINHSQSDIVLEVKKITKGITMAVGDGGNDVSMIFNSHCGIGIRGKEGQQVIHNLYI